MMSALSLPFQWLKARSDRLFLNVFALLGAAVGLANTALAWRLYGTRSDADVWMLAIVVVQALCLLSQLGVEQFSVFSAEAHALGNEVGSRFDRDSMTWAILFGIVCSVAFALMGHTMIAIFAHGYEQRERQRVMEVVLPLLLQVCFTPPLYVLRQQLLLRGRFRISIVSNNLFGYVQLAIMASAWLTGGISPSLAGFMTGLASAMLSAWFVLALGESKVLRLWPDWESLRPFIRASMAMRFTHSIHNFLVVLLTNNALSAGVEGTVALFQYSKKIADGLAAISIGPHLSLYHAAQARAWAVRSARDFSTNVRAYLLSAFPLLALAIGAFAVFAIVVFNVVPNSASMVPKGGFAVILMLLAWQTLVACESVPVGVLVLARRPEIILAINALFVVTFFAVTHWVIVKPSTGLTVATTSLACQSISTMLFSYIAYTLWRRKMQS